MAPKLLPNIANAKTATNLRLFLVMLTSIDVDRAGLRFL
jgi:hypothetical protein